MSVNEKMTALADEVRELSGTTTTKSIDAMTSDVSIANTEIAEQTDLINQIMTAIEDKAAGGGASYVGGGGTFSLQDPFYGCDNYTPAWTSQMLSGTVNSIQFDELRAAEYYIYFYYQGLEKLTITPSFSPENESIYITLPSIQEVSSAFKTWFDGAFTPAELPPTEGDESEGVDPTLTARLTKGTYTGHSTSYVDSEKLGDYDETGTVLGILTTTSGTYQFDSISASGTKEGAPYPAVTFYYQGFQVAIVDGYDDQTGTIVTVNETAYIPVRLYSVFAAMFDYKIEEDVTDETSAYTAKLVSLETAISALESELEGKASGGSGKVETCTVDLDAPVNFELNCIIYSDGNNCINYGFDVDVNNRHNLTVAKNSVFFMAHSTDVTIAITGNAELFYNSEGKSILGINGNCSLDAAVVEPV